MRAVKAGADDPAARAVFVEHRSTAHPCIETGAHLVTRKRQHNTVTLPFVYFPHNADARYGLVIQINVVTTVSVFRSARLPPSCAKTRPLLK